MLPLKRPILLFEKVFQGRELKFPVYANDDMNLLRARNLSPIEKILTLFVAANIYTAAISALLIEVLEGKPLIQERRGEFFDCFRSHSFVHRVPALPILFQNCFNSAQTAAAALFLLNLKFAELARRFHVRTTANFFRKIADSVRLYHFAVLAFK